LNFSDQRNCFNQTTSVKQLDTYEKLPQASADNKSTIKLETFLLKPHDLTLVPAFLQICSHHCAEMVVSIISREKPVSEGVKARLPWLALGRAPPCNFMGYMVSGFPPSKEWDMVSSVNLRPC